MLSPPPRPSLPLSVSLFLLLSCFSLSVYAQVPPDPSQDSVTDYAPSVNVECPDLSKQELVRVFTPQEQTLHPGEEEYINTRAQQVLPGAWKDWLGDGSRMGYDLSALNFSGAWPKLGIALPGGGLRAAQIAAGALSGLDARNESAKAAGTGGLLQVASYMSGLSGGSWVLGSLVFNNFPTLYDLVLGNGKDLDGWKLDLTLTAPDGNNILSDKNQAFFGSILWSVRAKADSGIDTSITDLWSRMISYHFLNQTTRNNIFTNDTAHGAGQLWSNIPDIPAYQNYLVPFPIVVAGARPVGSKLTTILDINSTVYEITPMELASYDPSLSAGMNLSFAGTHLTNKRPDNASACVSGFDQASFVMGTSASLFNQALDFVTNSIKGMSDSASAGLLWALSQQLQQVRTRANDVANWPSPFHGIKPNTFQDANATWLELIDGSSNQANVPYDPLFVRKRALDVIVTIDVSADDLNNFPNGSNLDVTNSRLKSLLQPSHQQFPPIPLTPEDFVATGVNARPTFFGCDPVNPADYPMVIYLPNAPPINGDDPVTNTATFQLTYTLKHTRLILDAAHKLMIEGFTPNANTPDPNFGTCLQCAVFDRARLKATPVFTRSAQCTQCFKQYCYDQQNPPNKAELPNRKFQFKDPDPQGVISFAERNKFRLIGGLIGLLALIGVLIGGSIWWRKRKERARYQKIKDIYQNELFTAPIYQRQLNDVYELPTHHGQL